jgi:hypothetical protein
MDDAALPPKLIGHLVIVPDTGKRQTRAQAYSPHEGPSREADLDHVIGGNETIRQPVDVEQSSHPGLD